MYKVPEPIRSNSLDTSPCVTTDKLSISVCSLEKSITRLNRIYVTRKVSIVLLILSAVLSCCCLSPLPLTVMLVARLVINIMSLIIVKGTDGTVTMLSSGCWANAFRARAGIKHVIYLCIIMVMIDAVLICLISFPVALKRWEAILFLFLTLALSMNVDVGVLFGQTHGSGSTVTLEYLFAFAKVVSWVICALIIVAVVAVIVSVSTVSISCSRELSAIRENLAEARNSLLSSELLKNQSVDSDA